MEDEKKNQENLKNNDMQHDAAGHELKRKRLKELKRTSNMIFIKQFDIKQCQGESDMMRIISKIKEIDLKTFVLSVDHTRKTRDNRVFVIVFKPDTQTNKIEQWANIIDKSRIDELGDDYQAFKYALNHHKKQENEQLKSIVIKGLRNETPSSVKRMFQSHGYTTIQSVIEWSKYGYFTVVFGSNKEATKLVSIKTITFGTQQAKIEFEKPRKKFLRGQPVQCKNCQKFGHTTRFCTSNTCCKYCTKSHKSHQCPIKHKSNKWRCRNCKGKHAANSTNCPKYEKICKKIGFKSQNPRELGGVAILRNRIFRRTREQQQQYKQEKQEKDEQTSKQQPKQQDGHSYASVARKQQGNGLNNPIENSHGVAGQHYITSNLIKNAHDAAQLQQQQQSPKQEKQEQQQQPLLKKEVTVPIKAQVGSIGFTNFTAPRVAAHVAVQHDESGSNEIIRDEVLIAQLRREIADAKNKEIDMLIQLAQLTVQVGKLRQQLQEFKQQADNAKQHRNSKIKPKLKGKNGVSAPNKRVPKSRGAVKSKLKKSKKPNNSQNFCSKRKNTSAGGRK